MELRHLRYFSFVIENGSLTKAAAQLNIAQPALSTQIRHLEEELGMQLLVRHSRGVEATAEGEELYKLATDLLRQFADLKHHMLDLNQNSAAKVVMGMTPSARNVIGTELVARAARSTPPIMVTIAEGMSTMLSEWLSIERLDVALLYDPLKEIRGMRSEVLLREDLFAFGVPNTFPSHATSISFQELAKFPLVLPALRTEVLARTVLTAAKASGIPLNISVEVQSMTTLRDYVISGEFTTILPYGAYLDEIDSGLLCAVKIVSPSMPREMHFAYSDRRNMTRAEWALRRMAREIAAERAAEHPEVWQTGTNRNRVLPGEIVTDIT